jgi:hypothetical protein
MTKSTWQRAQLNRIPKTMKGRIANRVTTGA